MQEVCQKDRLCSVVGRIVKVMMMMMVVAALVVAVAATVAYYYYYHYRLSLLPLFEMN